MSERTHVPRRPCSTSPTFLTGPRANVRSKFFPFLKWNTLAASRKKGIWGKSWRLMKVRTILSNRGISGLIALFCSSLCHEDTGRMKVTCCATEGTTCKQCNKQTNKEMQKTNLLCQRRNHLQVFSTSCCPHLARISPTFAFTWLKLTCKNGSTSVLQSV